MGKWNSSKTRVYPAFSNLSLCGERLKMFFEWVNECQERCKQIPLKDVDFAHVTITFADKDGKGEMGLAPSPSLLKWLVLNAGEEVELPAGHEKCVSRDTFLKREKLFDGDDKLRSEAIEKINRGCRRGWFVLEGYSKPDVYIETNKFIFLVEGKRTEPKPTEKTSFLHSSRDQLTRHMDCALELSMGKRVYGMTIFEEGHESEFADRQFDAMSVKHRSEFDQQRLSEGYLKPATWQSLQEYFQKHLKLDLGYIDKLP